ncbi:serine/threonine-protein kinase [Streptomyces sp. NPDC048639]|uniref:serine/threonine-protein kinase n=1 Tax=Streptomyces sp. NPDC048639 TaxID=3365581 RepID=UPI00371A5FD1
MSEAEQTQGTTGRLLAGRYRLGEVLGRGGMGTVWRAEDETLGRTVAVKELRFSSHVDEDEKQRLITRTLREAKAIARIRSKGAVTVYDVVDEDDRPWIVMELIEGNSLAEVIRETGGLTPHRAAEVGLDVLDVLRAAHREGILHRDVKPSNVLIADDGRVVLTDFGIAQVEGDPSVTSTGMLVGAPSYISPERARGHKPGPPADLWSLGGLLYACVEGVPPYDKSSALATLTAVMTEPLDPPKNAGPLEEVIYGLLAKDPDQRLDNAGARALLTDALNAPEDQGPEPPNGERTRMIPMPADPDRVPKSERAAAKSTKSAKSPKAAKTAGPAKATKAAAPVKAPAEPEKAAAERDGTKPARTPEPGAKTTAMAADAAPDAGQDVSPAPSAGARSEVERRLRSALATVRNAAKSSPSPAPGHGDVERKEPAAAPLTDVFSRRTLVIVAVVVALAVLGTILALAFRDGGEDGAKGGASGGDKAASAGSEGGKDKAKPQEGGQGDGSESGSVEDEQPKSGSGSGSDSGTGSDSGSGSGGGSDSGPGDAEVPDGYDKVSDSRFHFRMALPKDWKRTGVAGRNSGGIYSESGGFPRVQIDFSPGPTSDALAAWKSLEPAVRSNSSGYRLISLKRVDYRDYPTAADWIFERNQNGQRVRVLNRGFKVDADHGYSIMITCRADAWDGKECSTLRDTAFATFRPKD